MKFYWWEVQFSDKRGQPENLVDKANVYTVAVEPIGEEDVDRDEEGWLLETTSFVESDAFFVVKTAEDDPSRALARAVSMLYPDIMAVREDVIWHTYNLKN